MVGEQADNGAPLHGDVLEEMISHVASLDLVPASQVSKSWRSAVVSSLRRSSRRRFPWLIFHIHSHRHPFRLVATLAYDPHSRAWIPISRASGAVPPAAALHSSHPGLLHALSPSQLAISTDAFGSTWCHIHSPELWREDAVVALVGSRLIVAGGTCGFEGDPMSVEACDADVGTWEACEPLPEAFRGSASATWLSVAAGDQELHVLEKPEGLLGSFDVETKRWGRVCKLSMQPAVFLFAIGLAGERLILVGAAGEDTAVESIKLWEVGRDSHGTTELREIGVMPAEMVGRLVCDGWGLSPSIGFSVIGDLGYLYNPSELGEVFICEFGEGTCRWASAGETGEQFASHRVVFGCATVEICRRCAKAAEKKKLGRRLLYDRSANDEHERYRLSRLKQNNGGQFTSKIEGMDLQSEFMDFQAEDCSSQNTGIDSVVSVLTTGFWPTYKTYDLHLPSEMTKSVEAFKTFYKVKNKTRKLTWVFSMGTCLLTEKFAPKSIELLVTTPQAATLMLNDSDKLSFKEIMEQLNLQQDDVIRLLHSLSCTKYKILCKEPNTRSIGKDDIFTFNSKFTDRSRRVKVPLPPTDEKKKVFEDVDKDRKYNIDATIVRIMKSRKVIGYQELLIESVRQLNHRFKEDRENILRARATGNAVLTSPFQLLGSNHLGVVLTFPCIN